MSDTLVLEGIDSRARMLCNGIEEVRVVGESLEVVLADDADRASVYAEAVYRGPRDVLAVLARLEEKQAGIQAICDAFEDGNDGLVAVLLVKHGATDGGER